MSTGNSRSPSGWWDVCVRAAGAGSRARLMLDAIVSAAGRAAGDPDAGRRVVHTAIHDALLNEMGLKSFLALHPGMLGGDAIIWLETDGHVSVIGGTDGAWHSVPLESDDFFHPDFRKRVARRLEDYYDMRHETLFSRKRLFIHGEDGGNDGFFPDDAIHMHGIEKHLNDDAIHVELRWDGLHVHDARRGRAATRNLKQLGIGSFMRKSLGDGFSDTLLKRVIWSGNVLSDESGMLSPEMILPAIDGHLQAMRKTLSRITSTMRFWGWLAGGLYRRAARSALSGGAMSASEMSPWTAVFAACGARAGT